MMSHWTKVQLKRSRDFQSSFFNDGEECASCRARARSGVKLLKTEAGHVARSHAALFESRRDDLRAYIDAIPTSNNQIPNRRSHNPSSVAKRSGKLPALLFGQPHQLFNRAMGRSLGPLSRHQSKLVASRKI